MTLTLDADRAAAMLDALGLPADTTDPDLIVATVVDLATQAAGLDPAKPSTVAAAAKRAGLAVIDAATEAALRHDAAEGRKLAAAAAAAKVENEVDDAIAKGKILARSRRHWVTLISADPAMSQVLAGIAPETAVPLTEIGHSVDADGDLARKPAWFY